MKPSSVQEVLLVVILVVGPIGAVLSALAVRVAFGVSLSAAIVG